MSPDDGTLFILIANDIVLNDLKSRDHGQTDAYWNFDRKQRRKLTMSSGNEVPCPSTECYKFTLMIIFTKKRGGQAETNGQHHVYRQG